MLCISIDLPAQDVILKGKELFGDMRARQIGPAIMSGRINDIEGHPTNNRIIYIGAAGGGVWKSSNGGASFQPIFDDYAQSIGVVKLDPSNPDNIIWVGTGENNNQRSVAYGDGVYKSVDGGKSFKNMGLKNSEQNHTAGFLKVVLDSTASGIIVTDNEDTIQYANPVFLMIFKLAKLWRYLKALMSLGRKSLTKLPVSVLIP